MDIVVSDHPAQAAAARIAFRLRDAVRRRGMASVALSGGSAAPPMLAALAGDDVPWRRVTVWQVDERVAPDGSAARNAGQLAAFDGLPCTIRPMPVTSTDPGRAARRYGERLPDRLDVVHLGVGDDGHTASWPPDVPAVRDAPTPVELVGMFRGWERMTLTGRVVNAARCRVVLVVGAAKRSAVEGWLLGDRSLPISAVRTRATWLYVDRAAAPDVPLRSC